MSRLAGIVVAAVVAGGAGFWATTRPADLTDATRAALRDHPADAVRGQAVFWAAGCAGCHAAPGIAASAPVEARLVLAGGQSFASPFGTFRAPNVSMDPVHGIGDWTLDQFARATMLGVSPAGGHYYPAFPYTSYARATPGDVADLWAFWQTLPADATPSLPHEVGFPFSIRRALGLWKRINLDPGFVAVVADDPALERGRYLVEGLGHCAECHTPRDGLGGLDRERWLQGAPHPAGEGRIPALPPQGWSAADIAAYLQSGFTPSFDVAGGAMLEVIANTARLDDSDRAAMAAYLVALRASPSR